MGISEWLAISWLVGVVGNCGFLFLGEEGDRVEHSFAGAIIIACPVLNVLLLMNRLLRYFCCFVYYIGWSLKGGYLNEVVKDIWGYIKW